MTQLLLILIGVLVFGCTLPVEGEAFEEPEMCPQNPRARTFGGRPVMNPGVRLDIDDVGEPVRRAVTVIPPRGGEWSNSLNWGNSFNGPMPNRVGVEIPVFTLDNTYGPPSVHTVTLWSSQNIGATNGDIRAHVRYGAGGFRGEFYADWFNGASFSLPLTNVRITAQTWLPNATALYSPANGNILIGANVGRGSSGCAVPLTYTESQVTLANAATQSYQAPPFAKGFALLMTGNDDPATATNVDIRIRGATAVSGIIYDAQVFAGAQPMLLPGGTNQIDIVNGSGGNIDFIVQWILGL